MSLETSQYANEGGGVSAIGQKKATVACVASLFTVSKSTQIDLIQRRDGTNLHTAKRNAIFLKQSSYFIFVSIEAHLD